jgi:hypothetical protein
MLVYRMPPLSQLAYIIRNRIASTSALLRKTDAAGTANWVMRRDFDGSSGPALGGGELGLERV